MRSRVPSRRQAGVALTRDPQLAAVVAAGHAKRARNREILIQREQEREDGEPMNPAIAFVRVLLCGLFLLPLFGLAVVIVYKVEQLLGEIPAWIAGAAAFYLVAFAV